jgi:hypothetical protein
MKDSVANIRRFDHDPRETNSTDLNSGGTHESTLRRLHTDLGPGP